MFGLAIYSTISIVYTVVTVAVTVVTVTECPSGFNVRLQHFCEVICRIILPVIEQLRHAAILWLTEVTAQEY